MKKVLELIDGGFIGGGQTHILSIANNINNKDFNLFIAASPEGEFKKTVINKNHKFLDINLPKIYRAKHLKKLAELIDGNSIQLIHSHGGVAGMYARFLKKKFGNIKVIHTIHGIHYINSKNILRNFFSKTIEQHLVPYTDKFICVSDSDYKTADENKIIEEDITTVIKNGIDTKHFSGGKKSKEIMKKYGINENDTLIGNISRFDYQKNQRLLIHSVAGILKSNPGVKLLLVGDGTYKEECILLAKSLGISKQVIFTGEITNVEDFYPLIDIFVFPSLWEGLSITLIEAMSSGRCIIASDIASNRELIEDGKTGILFDLRDEKSLTGKIKLLLDGKDEKDRLSANAEKESQNYDVKKMVKKIEGIYRKVGAD